MKKYQDKKVAVWDSSGLYVELARKLAQSFGEVLYYHRWEGDYPTTAMKAIGAGFPELTKVHNIWDHYDDIDLWVFPHIYDGDVQVFLEKQGKRVWGSREGEAMEIYRGDFMEFQRKIGMDVVPFKVVIGIDALRKELYKSDDERFVKIDSDTRGDIETFRYINPEITEITVILPLEHKLGMRASSMRFIVQDKIETTVETGYDGFTVDGSFPSTAMFGIEVKDMGYVAEIRPYAALPEGVRATNDALKDALKAYGYRGAIHTEVREGTDGGHYLIDMTCRAGYPPTNLLMEMWTNMAECMWEGAGGVMVDMEFAARYGVEIEMFSESAKDEYYTLFMPDEIRPFVKQPYITRMEKDGRIWIVPQPSSNNNVGSLIAIGDSFEEVVGLIEKRAAQITGHALKIDVGCIVDAIAELKKL